MTYTTTTNPVTINVRDAFPIAAFAGDTVYVEFSKLPPHMLATLLEEGAQRILRDGIGAKDLSDVEKAAKLRKRIDAWMLGQFRITERDAQQSTLMKECYVQEQLQKHPGASQKQIESAMRQTVKAQLGDVNATFDNFLRAVSKQASAGDDAKAQATYEKLAGKYEQAAIELQKTRAAAASSVTIDLTDFDI
jgi:hypothetical protein